MGTPNFRFGTDYKVLLDIGQTTYNIGATLTNQTFSGILNLGNELTHYKDYTVDTDIAVTIAPGAEIGGSAEIRMISDGSHIPTFTPFVQSTSSGVYDITLAAINKVVFYYDGTSAFYSITVL